MYVKWHLPSKQASCGIRTSDSNAFRKCRDMEWETVEKCCFREISGCFLMRSVSDARMGGKKKMARMNTIQIRALAKTVILAKKRKTVAGAKRLRLRLSKSFQRDSHERGLRCFPVLFSGRTSGTKANNHFSSCQSPLIQR